MGRANSALDREAIIWIGCDGREVAEVLSVLNQDWRFFIRYCRSRLYVLKCVNYLKHGRFAEARKVCRGLAHFVSRCSVATTQSIKCSTYFQ